ncbi:MAG: geranylgeranyl reductase family protein [Pyrinomonadaceae bacterium]
MFRMKENPQSTIHNPKLFDALVVGAGPAGSFAAELLAKQGFSVALFDGRPEGEPKPCGGGVTSKALKAYPQLLDAVGRTIEDLEMFAPSGAKLYLKLDEPFAIYDRTVFDSFLRNRALQAGAMVFNEKVSLPSDDRENGVWTLRGYGKSENANVFQGRFLVAADGASSVIAKKLSGNLEKSEMEVAFGYRIPFSANDSKVRTVIAFLPLFAGYAWAFPRLDHLSFGIATAQDTFDHAKLDKILWSFIVGFHTQRENKKASIWQSLDKPTNAKLAKDLKQSAEPYAARIPGLAAETLDTRRTLGDGWALLGDAAGFADAVTGEGIYYALRSAEIFVDCFASGKDYEQSWRTDFGKELRRASQMRRRFYGNFLGAAFTERLIQFAKMHPGIRRTLRELVAGDQGYTNLKRTLARRALLPL